MAKVLCLTLVVAVLVSLTAALPYLLTVNEDEPCPEVPVRPPNDPGYNEGDPCFVTDPQCYGYYAPHPTHCYRYLQCAANRTFVGRNCSPGLFWNQVLGACDFPANVPCGGQTTQRSTTTTTVATTTSS
ncbi:hypothetical protein HA402_005222 [Bradysia odoriphaga]|uniref:Chitinase n=1 Tax=Bradysia odoriphaga TaxID=1564500 RepID=A0A385GMS0_9DIPT|nr:chitinase [Bradysia odoriphaga]KAG4070721.1 hypothetical protein HA402_005580 [Bradysia odoriphaga]KAG4079525.1 hypothetical protein HA402_005222 [Bradysia odoriphaga]